MRPVNKSRYTTNVATYNPYGTAKPQLIEAMGDFCSFCERHGFSAALDVEHVEHKNHHSDKETLWSNFLLACKNCNSIKGTKTIVFNDIYLPHIDDTFAVFEYLESGYVKKRDGLEAAVDSRTQELMDLVGLDRRPGSVGYSTKDTRWQERKNVWEIAKKYKNKYLAGGCDIETIVDLSLARGFWSVWMDAFSGHPIVQRALIDSFEGTRLECFQHIA